jgi:hypothetical protein
MNYTLPGRRRAFARVCLTLVVTALVLAPAACKGKKVRVGATDEETPRMRSVLNLGDPKV